MCDFEIDDNFLLEALEHVEKTEIKTSQPLSTPPDSEICNNFRGARNHEIFPNSNQSFPKSEPENIRSKLIKTLMDSRKNTGNIIKSTPTSNLKNTLSKENIFTPPNKQSSKRKLNKDDEQIENIDGSVFCSNLDRISESFNKDKQARSEDHSMIMPSPCFMKKSSLNMSSVGVSPIGSTVRKRKFPGPAGLLPKWEQRTLIKSDFSEDENEKSKFENISTEDSICSQTTAQDFVSGPWIQMVRDLEQIKSSSKQLLQNNIRWILRRASLRGHASIRKIPFLVVMVRSIDPSYTDATAAFHDETGEIPGTISKGVMEKYSEIVSIGTVFVLKDVTILSPASLQPGMGVIGQLKKHYLNITPNSIISIYSLSDEELVNKVEVVKMNESLVSSLLSATESSTERNEVIENADDKEKEEEEMSLFESVNGGREVNRNPLPNQRSFPTYKSPLLASKHIPFTKNRPTTTPNKPCSSKPSSSSSIEATTSFSSSRLCDVTSNPRPGNGRTSDPHRNTLERKGATDAFQSFSDDDDEEFDSLLASINTDSL